MARSNAHTFAAITLFSVLAHGAFAQTPTSEGPSPITGGQTEGLVDDAVSGAVNALAAHPSNANILYAGAVNGGIWRTTNATATDPVWTNLTDDLGSQSIGDLVFDTADASNQTLVAGIGLFSSFARIGGSRDGLLRTDDGGDTWTAIGADLNTLNVAKLAVHGNRIVAAVNFADDFFCNNIGIFRSTDGGASFQQLTGPANGMPTGASTAVTAEPGTPDTLYASIIFADSCEGSANGIYRSSNGGANWTKVSDAAVDATVTNDSGLTEIEFGTDGRVFVASTVSGQLAGVFYSDNDGASWTQMDLPGTNEPSFIGIHAGGQGSIHFSLAVDPADSDIVYIGGDRQPLTDDSEFPNSIGAFDFSGRLFRGDASASPGSQWTPLTHSGTSSSSAPHADSRDMAFDANGNLIEADDGGVYRRSSPQSGSGDWFSLNNNLQITEGHDMAYDSLSSIVITGNQDTGTSQQQFTGNVVWEAVQNGDGGDVAVDVESLAAFSESIRYSSFQNLAVFRKRVYDVNNFLLSTDFPDLFVISGAPFEPQFKTPVVINSVNADRMIFGGENGVYESLDQGDTISVIVPPGVTINQLGGRAVAYGSTTNEDILYVGAEDSLIYRRTTGGGSLTQLTLPTSTRIADLTMDRDLPSDVFYIDATDVYYSSNSGDTFSSITGDLSGGAGRLRALTHLSGASVDALILGGNDGLFASTAADGYSVWTPLSSDMPAVPIFEFDYDAGSDTLYVGTLGRGTFSLPGVLASLSDPDTDGDGIADSVDNCTLVPNADQRDTNGDGYGNICDADLNNDGIINAIDLGLFRSVFFTNDDDADFNGDNIVNTIDLGVLKIGFFGAPGPSGLAP